MNSFTTRTITNKSTWENFVLKNTQANFLSSWNWGQFHTNLNKKVFYQGIYQGNKLTAVSLLVKETAKRGNYLTIAGGPILDFTDQDLLKHWINIISSLAKDNSCAFVRIRPQIIDTRKNRDLLKSLGFSPSPMHLTADLTLVLDLRPSESDLLSQMRKSTRYEIKKADKLDIKVSTSPDPGQIKQFHQHQLYLAKKHHFTPFSYQHLYQQFKTFAADNQVLLFNSFKADKLLASAYVIFYGQEAVYHYGISTPQNQKLPGSYACQWAAIKHAKSLGLKRYNFWGIAPLDSPKDHRFAGVSLFKRGFGGQELAYLPAHDLPTSSLYPLIKLFERLRAKSRRLS